MKSSWSSITTNFPDEKACLESYIVWQAAEVLMRVKPANLANVTSRDLPCGRNLARLWDSNGAEVLEHVALQARELRATPRNRLVLFYDPEHLLATLRQPLVAQTLKSLGYTCRSAGEALSHLASRITDRHFPHEIGFFLGYPPKDVLSFMGLLDRPLTCTGPWKIYGDTGSSLRVVARHRTAKERIVHSLSSGVSPHLLLRKPESVAA